MPWTQLKFPSVYYVCKQHSWTLVMHRAIKCRFGKNEIERQISSIVCSTFLDTWNFFSALQNLNFMCGVCKFLKRVKKNCSSLLEFFFEKKECGYKRVLWQPQFLISFCINEYKNGNMCGWLTLEFFSLTHNFFLQPFVSRDFSNNYFHSHTSLRDDESIIEKIYLLAFSNKLKIKSYADIMW